MKSYPSEWLDEQVAEKYDDEQFIVTYRRKDQIYSLVLAVVLCAVSAAVVVLLYP